MIEKVKDSRFLSIVSKRYVKALKQMNPKWDEDDIKKIVDKQILKRVKNPKVVLDNNYIHQSRETSLLSVFDWCLDTKPIICGNATFFKQHSDSFNPNALMLKTWLANRKAVKKEMFKIEDYESFEYQQLNLKQMSIKVNVNSEYGASGAKSSAFYSKWCAAGTTYSAQSCISTAYTLFEGCLGDNYDFLDINECIEWCNRNIEKFKEDGSEVDNFIVRHTVDGLVERLYAKIIDDEDGDKDKLRKFLSGYNEDEITLLYYKNNIFEFIEDHEDIRDIIYSIFSKVKNLDYVNDEDEGWYRKIPEKYQEKFYGSNPKNWNRFVNKTYFMDPNSPPDEIIDDLKIFTFYLLKYVRCKYLSVDRIYRLKNFKRNVVTIIDTDSNILSLDPLVNYIMDNVLHGEDFNRGKENNVFICINMLAYFITQAIEEQLLYYGEMSNVAEEYRPIYNMKNEYLFLKLIIDDSKKRYINKIALREGNLMNPPLLDLKGFDFKKASTSEHVEKRFEKIIKKRLIGNDIDINGTLSDIFEFRKEIEESLDKGETKYLGILNAKELGAYANPDREQSVRGVLMWNMLNPDDMIEPPAKVNYVKLNLFVEEDLEGLDKTYPEIYEILKEKVFHDKSGIFVTKSTSGGKEHIINKGAQVLAIPYDGTIPDWCRPYVDKVTIVNDIIAPFSPVMEIFGITIIKEGKSSKRQSKSFSNIVKL